MSLWCCLAEGPTLLGCGLGPPLSLHSNSIVQTLRPIYGKRRNVYITESALDKTLEREKKNEGWKKASPNKVILPFWTQMLEKGGEGGTEKSQDKECQRPPKLVRDSHGLSLWPGAEP